MATLCTVIVVGNNAWLADWCRLEPFPSSA